MQAEWDKERAKQASRPSRAQRGKVREEESAAQLHREQIDHDNQARIQKAQSDAALLLAFERLRRPSKPNWLCPCKSDCPVIQSLPSYARQTPRIRELRSCASRYVLAGEADKAYSAGLVCEKWADSLKVN